MRKTLILSLLVGAIGCSAPPATEDPVVAEQPPPEPPAEPPADEPPPPPDEKPEPKPQAPAADVRYPGRTIVATAVEREQVRCTGEDANASLQDNRKTCVRDLMQAVQKPDHLIVVIDEMAGQPCPNCVSMLAEVSPVASDPPGQVLFLKETAGTVECSGGDAKLTLEQTRKQCYETLQKEGASLRAGVVLPMGIEEGEACKSCISIVGTGYTATMIP